MTQDDKNSPKSSKPPKASQSAPMQNFQDEPFLIPEERVPRKVTKPLLWFGLLLFVILSSFWKMKVVKPSEQEQRARYEASIELQELLRKGGATDKKKIEELMRKIKNQE